MFRNKGFTITFIIFSILIVLLSVFLFYLMFGKGKSELIQAVSQKNESSAPTETLDPAPVSEVTDENTEDVTERVSETAESETSETVLSSETESDTEETETETSSETETESETEPDNTLRALKDPEKHDYPIIGEELKEEGTLTVIKPGDAGEGLVFHGKPEFDAWDTPGNVTRYEGSFEVIGKIYVLSNDRACLMYHTGDGYYVTSSPVYVSYEPISTKIGRDPLKTGIFGQNDEQNLYAEILSDDGDEVVFSLYNYSYETRESSPVITNVIASYETNGVADFEYHHTDGQICTGTIAFESVSGAPYTKLVDIVFSVPIHFEIGDMTEIVLHN